MLYTVGMALWRFFPPPLSSSLCLLVVLFGHLSAEYFYPGGFRAFAAAERQHKPYPRWSRGLLWLTAVTCLLIVVVGVLVKRPWLPLDQARRLAIVSILLLVAQWTCFMAYRDVLLVTLWPRDKSEMA